MFNNLLKNYIYPIAVFSGGMIGVGFLSLPYVAMKVGIGMMVLYFLIITTLVVVINNIFCQISLKTPDYKRFPGFVEFHLGKWPKYLAMCSVIFGTVGVLLAYILVGGQFLTSVFQPFFSGNVLTYVLIYFFLVSIIIYFDIKVIARIEFWVVTFLFICLLSIFIVGFSQIKFSNIFNNSWAIDYKNIFLPYGPLLFALWGIGLIPEVEEMISGQKKKLKNIVMTSTIAVSIFYFLFVLLILGITGKQTVQAGLDGLKGFLPDILVLISLLIGSLATITAFISQGIIFKKTLIFDLKIKHWQAFTMTCCPPLILLLLGFNSFIPLLALIGGVSLGINGILILLMYKKIGGKNIIVYPFLLVFLMGAIYELIYFIK